MNQLSRQVIAVAITGLLVWALYFGSWLPLRKSQQYIQTRQTEIKSLEQFNSVYDVVLGYQSPVGQEEVVANYLELIASIIDEESKRENPNKEVIHALVGKAEEWALPIVERRVGFSYSQILFSFGGVYRSATIVLQDQTYYQKAVDMYKLGLEFSPDRQVFLYSLFDTYRFGGDKENARKIGERIVEVYKDGGVAQILQNL